MIAMPQIISKLTIQKMGIFLVSVICLASCAEELAPSFRQHDGSRIREANRAKIFADLVAEDPESTDEDWDLSEALEIEQLLADIEAE